MAKSKKRTVRANLKRYLLSGLAVVVPLFITFYLIYLVFRMADNLAGRHINTFLMDEYGFYIPGIGLLFLLAVIVITGALVSNFLGKKIYAFFDRIFNKMPLIANIYPSARKLSDFLFRKESKDKFKKVVLVEYPHSGSYSIGFLTNKGIEEFNDKTGKKLVTVLVPLSPMPYSGLLMALPREKITELDMNINDALKLVLSSGVVVPGGK